MKQVLRISRAHLGSRLSQRSPSFALLSLHVWTLGALLLVAGCGGSEPEEPSRVEPPAPENAAAENAGGIETAAEGETNAPEESDEGGAELELPSMDLPDPSELGPAETEPSGGIEMPKDVTIPESSQSEDPEADSNSSSSEGGSAESSGNGGVNIKYAKWDEIQAEAKSTGRVTVVDLWSLTCEPCLREFPSLVELNESMGDSVEFMAVNLDFDGRKTRPPNYYEDRIQAFLDDVGARSFPQFVSQTPADEVFEAADVVSIPAVLIFDAEGKLAHVFVDADDTAGFTYEDDVAPLLRKMAG